MSSNERETYGVYLTPHVSKYQNADLQETTDIAHDTWNFGNVLKANGVDLVYMHGPIGLYEGLMLKTTVFDFKKRKGVDQVLEFLEYYADSKKDLLFFLYQKHAKTLCFAVLTKETVEASREASKPKKKAKTVKRKVDKQATES
jgi:hypothetical protein